MATAAVLQFAVNGSLFVRSARLHHAVGVWAQIILVSVVILILASLASNRIGWLTRMITRHETAHLATLDLVGQLEIQNTLLKTLARSNDIGLAFQSLAWEIARVVACDRLGRACARRRTGRTCRRSRRA